MICESCPFFFYKNNNKILTLKNHIKKEKLEENDRFAICEIKKSLVLNFLKRKFKGETLNRHIRLKLVSIKKISNFDEFNKIYPLFLLYPINNVIIILLN